MIDRKKIREIIGYTHQEQINNPDLWYKKSLAFHEATIVLYKFQECTSENIYLFTAALSLELIFKTILVMKGEEINKLVTHDLKKLCIRAQIQLNEDQRFLLDFFTHSIYWFSRYPGPKKEEEWDNFQDNIFEKLKVRSQSGSTTGSVRAHSRRFPSIENYNKIWEMCLAKYESILL